MTLPPRFTWTKIETNQLPPGRQQAASVVYENELFIHGGRDNTVGGFDDFWCFNFETNSFQQLQVIGEVPSKRYGHTMTILEKEKAIYLFGGQSWDTSSKDTVYFNDLWKYDINDKIWTQMNQTNPPCPRTFFVSFVHEDKLYVFGGLVGFELIQRDSVCANDLHSYDFKNHTWTKIQTTGSIPYPRKECAWVKYENKLFIHGGAHEFPKHIHSGCYRMQQFLQLDLNGFVWSEMDYVARTQIGTPRAHSSFVYNNILYFIVGSSSHIFRDIFCYDFSTKFWSQHWSMPDDNKRKNGYCYNSCVAQIYKEDIYVLGGHQPITVLERAGKKVHVSRLSRDIIVNGFYKLRVGAVPLLVPYQSRCFTRNFGIMINSPEDADFCFLVEGEKIYAHKCILSARSDHFKQILRDCRAGVENEIMINSGISHATFLKVMEFLYTGEIDTLNVDIADLLVAAEKYKLKDLIHICTEAVCKEISTKTAVQILITSHRHKFEKLKESALDFILRNWDNDEIKNEIMNKIDDNELLQELLFRKQ